MSRNRSHSTLQENRRKSITVDNRSDSRRVITRQHSTGSKRDKYSRKKPKSGFLPNIVHSSKNDPIYGSDKKGKDHDFKSSDPSPGRKKILSKISSRHSEGESEKSKMTDDKKTFDKDIAKKKSSPKRKNNSTTGNNSFVESGNLNLTPDSVEETIKTIWEVFDVSPDLYENDVIRFLKDMNNNFTKLVDDFNAMKKENEKLKEAIESFDHEQPLENVIESVPYKRRNEDTGKGTKRKKI